MSGTSKTRRRLRRPRPGIYRDVPFSDYQAWPFVNNSSLGAALLSGKHYELSLSVERSAPSSSQVFGSLVDAILMDQPAVDREFAVKIDPVDQLRYDYRSPRSSAEYKGLVAKHEKENRGKAFVSQDTMDGAVQCADSLRSALGSWLMPENCQVSIVSTCPESGMRLKCRPDLLCDDAIIDVKTTRNLIEFESEIEKYAYHRQAAFYQDAVEQRTGRRLDFWIAACESSPPYCTLVAPIDPVAIEAGRRDVALALRRIAQGQETGVYPGPRRRRLWRLPQDAKRVADVCVGGKYYEVR